MAVVFNLKKHQKLWLLMRDNIVSYMSGRNIPTFYDAETTVDDLKALQFKNENMGTQFKEGRRAPLFYCYACQYAWDVLRAKDKTAERRERCVYCPLEGWNADKCFSSDQFGVDGEGLFHELCQAVEDGDTDRAYVLCEEIAHLNVRQGVEVGDDEDGDIFGDNDDNSKSSQNSGNGSNSGSGNGGSDTRGIDAEVITLTPGGSKTINRENTKSRMPVTVLVKTNRGYTRSDDIIRVAYNNNSVIIVNETDENVQFVVIDSDEQIYSSAEEGVIPAGAKLTRERPDNLRTIPVTVLAQDNFSSKTALRYIDAAPYLTVAHGENGYTIKNELDEPVSFMILQNSKAATRSTETILSGASLTLSRPGGLKKNLPVVLVKDLTNNSENYNTWLSANGLLDVVINVNGETMTIYNDTPEAANIMILDPKG